MQGTMPQRLSDFSVLSFDCYGTLIDWETGIWDALQPLIMHNAASGPARSAALSQFGTLESRLETDHPAMPYPEVLRRVHAAMAAAGGLRTTDALDHEFGRSIGAWPAFPDTAEALRFLKTRFRLVILSNVDRAGFAASNRKLGVAFDAIYTAEDIGSYKPSQANFRYLVNRINDELGVGRERILHTAQSLYHDHAPARACGLSNCWIDRQCLSQGGTWGATAAVEERPKVDFLFYSLAELAKEVRAASA
jgi:2-haloalkanoic acid dehalogenase type II